MFKYFAGITLGQPSSVHSSNYALIVADDSRGI